MTKSISVYTKISGTACISFELVTDGHLSFVGSHGCCIISLVFVGLVNGGIIDLVGPQG